ncbi:MAG: DUF6702 family protein [Gemmatimonadaceae bacterium]
MARLSAGRALAAVFATFLPLGAAAPAHPLHNSLCEIEYVPAEHRTKVTLKLFVDDFGKAVARRTSDKLAPDRALADAAMFAYIRSAFAILGKDGKPMSLEWAGTRRTTDLILVSLTLATPNGLAGLRVQDNLMFDMFADQANIVQARYGGHTESLLFTKGDGAKGLP